MRSGWWSLIRFLHVGAAILWVGGQLTLSYIVRPVTVKLIAEEDRKILTASIGTRFARIAAMGLIPILLATGLALAFHRGVTLSALGRPGYPTILTLKVMLALVSFALAMIHGIAASRSTSTTVRVIATTGTLVSLAVVALAVSLVP